MKAKSAIIYSVLLKEENRYFSEFLSLEDVNNFLVRWSDKEPEFIVKESNLNENTVKDITDLFKKQRADYYKFIGIEKCL